MEIAITLEESEQLLKPATKTIENETKNKEIDFLESPLVL